MTGQRLELTDENLRDLNSYVESHFAIPPELKEKIKEKKKEEKKEDAKEDGKEVTFVPEPPIENTLEDHIDSEQHLTKTEANSSAQYDNQQSLTKGKLNLLPSTSKPATPESLGGLFFKTKFNKSTKPN